MIRAFIFDVDGTLVDTRELHINAWQKALAAFGLGTSIDRIQGQLGRRAVDMVKELVPESEAGLRHDVLEAKWQAFRDSYGDVRAFPKTHELFAFLHEKGLALALATSAKRRDTEFYVEMLAIGAYLQAVVTAEDIKHSKPHPEIFLTAATRIGVEPREAIVVGDSTHDMEAAARAGMRPIGVLTGGTGAAALASAGALLVFDDIADVYAHLEDII